MTNNKTDNNRPTRKKVVILGGGFGGVYCARYLRRFAGKQLDIELINHTNYFVFQPLLPEVVAGTISAPDSVTSLRLLLPGVKIRMAEIHQVDLDAQSVRVLQGSKRKPQTIHYDHLVLAPGQKSDNSRLPGFAEHSLTLRNVSDAHSLRNHVIQCLEHADVTGDEALKRRLLTFVVAGGGFSGVETLGELMEMVRRTRRHYPNIQPGDLSFVLLQRGSRILPELPETLAAAATSMLTRRGADIRLNTSLQAVTGTGVHLANGTRIASATVVSTIGSGPSALTETLNIPLDQGKIPTDAMLRVAGYDNVWALGDAASIQLQDGAETSHAPPTAQFARQEARLVAANIAAGLRGDPPLPFNYRPRGALASLGNYQGVAEIYGVRISGLFAWILWRAVYIGMLPGATTKLRVALNWMFDYFAPRSIVQISNDESSACRYVHYSRGDIVYESGQYIDGLYLIVAGALQSRVYDEDAQENFVRVLKPGDHWGERSLIADTATRGTLVALQDTRVLLLKKQDFAKLRTAFPAIDGYLTQIPDDYYPHALRTHEPREPVQQGPSTAACQDAAQTER